MSNLFFTRIREAAYPGLSIAAAAVVPCLTVFLNNRGHFTIRTGAAFGMALIVTAGIVLVCSIPLLVIGERRGRGVLTAVLQALAVTMVLQYYFLSAVFSWTSGLSGQTDWSLIVLTVFHILALLLPFAVMIFFRAKIRCWSGKITAVIVLSQLVMLIGPLREKPEPDYDFRRYTISDEGKFTFASKNNLIVIVVDCMGERIGKEVLRKYPDLRHSLRDFTCFDRITSPLPRTMYAVPAMLCGIDFPRNEDGQPGNEDHAKYLNDVYRAPDSLFQLCRAHGWRREGYPLMLQTLSYSPEVIDNTLEINYRAKKQSAVKIIDSVLENLVPGFLQSLLEEYYYFATDPFITPTQKTDRKADEPFDREFYRQLQKEFRVGDFPNGMKYMHLLGAHEPVRTNEKLELSHDSLKYQQLRGSLKIVELLIEKLRQAGLYDAATIVITGDHTERYTPEILTLIKRPGERHETMVINSVPGQVSDLAGTLAKCSGLNPQARSLFDSTPLPGSLRSIRGNDISSLDFPVWQTITAEPLFTITDSLEIPFTVENRKILIDLAHEKLAGLRSITLTAKNLLTGYCAKTSLTLDRNVNYVRADTAALPKGVYRIGISTSLASPENNGELEEKLPVLLPLYLAVRDHECVFTRHPEEIKPRPMRIGQELTIQPMTPIPELILPENHDPTDKMIRLTGEKTLSIRLPASDRALKMTFAFKYLQNYTSELTIHIDGKKLPGTRWITGDRTSVEIPLPPGKERLTEFRFCQHSMLSNRLEKQYEEQVRIDSIRLDAVGK